MPPKSVLIPCMVMMMMMMMVMMMMMMMMTKVVTHFGKHADICVHPYLSYPDSPEPGISVYRA